MESDDPFFYCAQKSIDNLTPFWILDFGFWIGKALLAAESANLSVALIF